jgi:glycoside/pentoside/hexuronide:cation symporter, GPH family
VINQQLSTMRIIGFSLGSVGTGLFSTTPAVLLLFYMTQLKGVAAGLAGLALLLPKLWDMFTDPFIGRWSDTYHSKYGRRLPFMLAGALLMPLGLILMFSVPETSSSIFSFWFILISYLFSATAYTLFSVPYITIPAEISDNADERLKIMSYRTAGVMLGIILGSGLPPFLISILGQDAAAYQQTAIILAIICVSFMLCSILSIKSLSLLVPKTASHPVAFWVQFKQVMQPLFGYLVITHVLQIIAVGILLASATYLAVFANGLSPAAAGAFLTATFTTAMLAMPLWQKVSLATSRITAFALGAMLYMCMAIAMLIYGLKVSYFHFISLGVGFGLGFAAIQMIPYALLTDTIHQHGQKHGFGSEGVFTGIWTATEKLGLAIAPFLVGTAIQFGGFTPGTDIQSQAATEAILFTATLIPILLMALSMLALYAFQQRYQQQQTSGHLVTVANGL